MAAKLVVFCDCPDDATAIAAARVLMGAGLPRVRVLAGGLDAWAGVASAGRADADGSATGGRTLRLIAGPQGT